MKKLQWIIFSFLFLIVFIWVYKSPILNYGGDIAEYHGITESVIKSQTLALTPVAEYNLRRYLQPAYYDNNPGYYIKGTDGNRYPVHFVLYSLLAVPTRLVLHIFSINELQSLRLTNVLILFTALFIILKYLVVNSYKRSILLIATLLSPIMYFLSWPGPDIFYLSILLISIFCFFQKKYFLSAFLSAIASLHSQPLTTLVVLQTIYAVANYIKINNITLNNLKKHLEVGLKVALIILVVLLPIFYNLIYFGTWSLWPYFKDGWTTLNGFGLQNLSPRKLYEQFFDLNIGIFFYTPILIASGIYFIKRFYKKYDVAFLTIAFLITAFFYQTNPAWHYGMSGYGPTRHALFLIPLFIVYFVFLMQKSIKHYILLGLIILTQIPIMLMNGYVSPNITNSFNNTPIAQFVLNNWPFLYNPTPEIFVDRTNHIDVDYPTSAIYKFKGECKKAYIVLSDLPLLRKACNNISVDKLSLLDDSLSRKSNIYRTTKTNEATFWPDTSSCSQDYKGPYICMKNTNDFVKLTGITDSSRIIDMKNGVFKFKKGSIETIKIPPGYFIQYNSMVGKYINF